MVAAVWKGVRRWRSLGRQRRHWRRWRGLWRRWFLWGLLVLLVASMLVTLVWLAGRHEADEVQARLERDTASAVAAVQAELGRNLSSMQALRPTGTDPAAWRALAQELLRGHRALLRFEWRDEQLRLQAAEDSPYGVPAWDLALRDAPHSDVSQACVRARRIRGASYADTYFQPSPEGLGAEVLEVCLPLAHGGFVVGTYGLRKLLTELVLPRLQPMQEASFTEPDGTRLALARANRRGSRMFTARQLLTLPGTTLMLRVDGWHQPPSVFPNVLTALVTVMSIALVSVLVVLVRDNRRRLSAERELGDALSFRQAMENSLLTGLRARDMAGRITYVNPAFCQMVGYAPEELLGSSTPPPYWPPEHAALYHARQQAHLDAGGQQPLQDHQLTYMRKDGTRFPVVMYEAPLVNARGARTGWMASFLDVSEQRRAEELSRASQERLQATARLATVGEMASLLSHELNQPLAVIASYATGSLNWLAPQVRGREPDRADLRELTTALERIAAQAERAGRVIKSVHDFLRRRDHVREAVAPRDLLDAVLPLIRLQARKLEVEVVLALDDALPLARCDRTMVEQVVLNLARNAMQAMDAPALDRRVLTLSVRRADRPGWLAFAVADLGTGLPATVAERLFTPFFTTRSEGMGLGLSLCRTVIEQHGGVLRFAANAPRGTVFTFTLPIAA